MKEKHTPADTTHFPMWFMMSTIEVIEIFFPASKKTSKNNPATTENEGRRGIYGIPRSNVVLIAVCNAFNESGPELLPPNPFIGVPEGLILL